MYGRGGFLEQPKEDVPVQLDRLHARAEDNDDEDDVYTFSVLDNVHCPCFEANVFL